MRYPTSILDDIKARLPTSLVVGRKVALKKTGREWRGLSPFNAEKTPSFFVNDHKQAWFDFSSGRNGDIFTFLIETEGVSFGEAVERLAAEAGVVLPIASPLDAKREEKRKNLYEIMELAAEYFMSSLKSAQAREARDYLTGRGILGDVRTKFMLGYAPEMRFGLRDHLAAKSVAIEGMIEAGLLVHGEGISVPYDRFRDRIMFPIQDAKGRIIAFGGRALQKDVSAKYLNSPETPLFHKGDALYNLHRARKAAHEHNNLIVVEGYVDVIALDRAGLAHVVAPLGTALTEAQLALIWRLASTPILCFDGDKAGIRAAYRALDLALPHLSAEQTINFCFLPSGYDPDDLLRHQGAEALRQALTLTRPLVDVLFDREIEKNALDTPEQRAACEKRLFTAIHTIKNEDLRRHYRQAMLEKWRQHFRPSPHFRAPTNRGEGAGMRPAMQGGGGGYANNNAAPWRKEGAGRNNNANTNMIHISENLRRSQLFQPHFGLSSREAALVVAAIRYSIILEAEAEILAELVFESALARKIRTALLDCAAHHTANFSDPPETINHNYWADLKARGLETELELLSQSAAAERWTEENNDIQHVLSSWREAALLHKRQSFLNNEIDSLSRGLLNEGGEIKEGGEERFERLKTLLNRREALPEQE